MIGRGWEGGERWLLLSELFQLKRAKRAQPRSSVPVIRLEVAGNFIIRSKHKNRKDASVQHGKRPVRVAVERVFFLFSHTSLQARQHNGHHYLYKATKTKALEVASPLSRKKSVPKLSRKAEYGGGRGGER